MSYEEKLRRLLGNNDPFWYTTIDNFIKETYENEEQGINDIENLAKDTTKFNEFTKQIIQKRNDLKSVKEEFFIGEDINIEDIAEKLVHDIQKLEDNIETSISVLVNKKIDSKTMFNIYHLVIEKLKEVGLYLNFGEYENKKVGLPFNIPFKKGYVQNIVIETRIYNGRYGKGSIFKNLVDFKLAGGNATTKSFISFCVDEKIKNNATLECSIPSSLTEEEISKINHLIAEIKIKYQPYDTNAQREPLPEYLKYTDLNINGVAYAISTDDEMLKQLRILIKSEIANYSLAKSYDVLVNSEK